MEDDPERVDIRTRIDAITLTSSLFRTHVLRRAQNVPIDGRQGSKRALFLDRARDAEVDHLGQWKAVLPAHEQIRRLEIAVDDAPTVSVIDGTTHLQEENESLPQTQLVIVTVLGDRYSIDVLQDEIRPAILGLIGIEHLGDVRVIQLSREVVVRVRSVAESKA